MTDILTGQLGKLLANYIADALNNLMSMLIKSAFFINESVYTISSVGSKVEVMQGIANRFLVVTMVACVCMFLYRFDISTNVKLKRIVEDCIIAVFLINTAPYFIFLVNSLANNFVTLWIPSTDNLGSTMMQALGITGSPSDILSMLSGTGMFLLSMIQLVISLLMLMILVHSIIQTLLNILYVLFPFVMSFYPTQKGKQLFDKILSLYIGLISIAPLQALALGLFKDSITTSGSLSMISVNNVLGTLIVLILLIPGSIFYVIAQASNPAPLQ